MNIREQLTELAAQGCYAQCYTLITSQSRELAIIVRDARIKRGLPELLLPPGEVTDIINSRPPV